VIAVVKIGTSSITDEHGEVAVHAIEKLCAEVAGLRGQGHRVVIVTSGAIGAGLSPLGLAGKRPSDLPTLQAVSAVGQGRLIRVYDDVLRRHNIVCGQVLLTPLDFIHRQQYLHARQTLARLLDLGVVPIVNENDAVADDEIRFGDNDRMAALVAHLVGAHVLVLLTDMPGLLTADPRFDQSASLIEEIVEIDHELERVAGGAGTDWGSGGMASKLAAAKMAAWSGTIVVDDGARRALTERGTSLLPAGVVEVSGSFDVEDAVEIVGTDGRVFAKGLSSHPAGRVKEWAGRRTVELPEDVPHEVVHRDNLVMLP
jgi:glutamate 5-kinase